MPASLPEHASLPTARMEVDPPQPAMLRGVPKRRGMRCSRESRKRSFLGFHLLIRLASLENSMSYFPLLVLKRINFTAGNNTFPGD